MDSKSPKREGEQARARRGGDESGAGATRSGLERPRRGRRGDGEGTGGSESGPGGKAASESGRRGRLGRRSQPSGELRARMPAAARRRGTGGGRGGGDPGPRGEIPGSQATSRGRAGRRGRGSLPAPAPSPRRPARAEGPPRAPPRPGGLRAPPSSAPPSPPQLPAGCLPGPEPVRGGSARDSPALPPAWNWGEWGFREREGEWANDAQAGKDRWMSVFFEARCWGKRSEGTRVTREHGLSCQPQTREPLPHHTCAPLRSLRAQSLGPHTHPPPPGSPRKAPISGSRRAWGLRRSGEGRGSPASRRTGARLCTRGSPGMPGSQRPLPPLGRSRACSPLPSGTSLSATARNPGERRWLLSGGAGSRIPEGRLGQPQRPGRRICQADGNSEGARCVRKACYPCSGPTAPALPLETAFAQKCQPNHRKGQPPQRRVTC